MRKRKLPAAILTLLAVSASTVAIAGCGSKEEGGSTSKETTTTHTTSGLKHGGKYKAEGKGYGY